MTINRAASHQPTRWRPVAVAVLAAAAIAALALATVPAVSASTARAAARPSISTISFSGTQGPGVASPTVTITGTHFGAAAPPGTSNSVTSCGTYTANGDVYGSKLYFTANAHFEAGYSTSSSADCIGIIVVSWSATKVVLKFGNSYGSFAHWYLSNGDGFAVSIKTAIGGGAVSGLT